MSSVCFQLDSEKVSPELPRTGSGDVTLHIQHAHSASIEHRRLLPAIEKSDKKEQVLGFAKLTWTQEKRRWKQINSSTSPLFIFALTGLGWAALDLAFA